MRNRCGRRATLHALGLLTAVTSPLIGSPSATAVAPPAFTNCVAGASATFTNPADVAIPDEGVATSTIAVSGLSGQVLDVDVTTRITHTASGDLDILLTSPSGKVVPLSVGNGAVLDNVFNGTTWDDDADPDGVAPYVSNAGLVTDHPYADGAVATPLVPQVALAAFAGDNANGNWTLTVADTVAGDVGAIDDWGLTITTGTRSTPAPFGSLLSPAATGIPDGGSIQVPLSVGFAAPGSQIAELTVRTSIAYANVGDLQVTLTSPAGTVVTLTTGNGVGSNGTFGNVEWSTPTGAFIGEGLPEPVSAVLLPAVGPVPSLAPEESFGAFIGESAVGVWTLTIADVNVNGVAGTLNDAGLSGRVIGPCRAAHDASSSPAPTSSTIGSRLPITLTPRTRVTALRGMSYFVGGFPT